MGDGGGVRKYSGVTFLPPPPPPSFRPFGSSKDRECNSSEMRFRGQKKGWNFQSFKVSGGGECEGFGDEKNGMEEEEVEEGESFVAAEKEHDSNGQQQSKLCARGHWRPAEDAKVKELVSQYGPMEHIPEGIRPHFLKIDGDSRNGKSCQQLLDLMPDERDWLVRDRCSLQVTEEKKLELRLGPPKDWISDENSNKDRDDESLLLDALDPATGYPVSPYFSNAEESAVALNPTALASERTGRPRRPVPLEKNPISKTIEMDEERSKFSAYNITKMTYITNARIFGFPMPPSIEAHCEKIYNLLALGCND